MSDLRALLETLAEAGDQLAGWHMDDGAGAAYEAFLGMTELPETLSRVAGGLAAVAGELSQGPFNPPVLDVVGDTAAYQRMASASAEDIEPVFRSEHAVEIRRFEDPKPGESTWNVLCHPRQKQSWNRSRPARHASRTWPASAPVS